MCCNARNEIKTRARSHCSFQRGEVSIDLTGKKSGRGAYLSKDKRKHSSSSKEKCFGTSSKSENRQFSL